VAEEPTDDQRRPLSHSKCAEFAEKLTESVEGGHLLECSKLFDFDHMFDRLTAGLKFHYSDRDATLSGWRSGMKAGHMPYAALVQACDLGATFRLVKCNVDRQEIVMRLLTPNGEFQHLVMEVSESPDGRLLIRRMSSPDSFASWEVTVAGALGTFTQYDGPDGKISPEAPGYAQLVKDKTTLFSIPLNLAEENYWGALKLYNELSPEIQHLEYPLILGLSGAVRKCFQSSSEAERTLDIAEAQVLLARYDDEFPKGASRAYFAFAIANAAGDDKLAYSELNNVKTGAFDDPFLLAYLSLIDLRQGRVNAARDAAERSRKAVDYSVVPYLAVYAAATAQNDQKRVEEVGKVIKERFSEELQVMADGPWAGNIYMSSMQVKPLLQLLGVEPAKR
jgi:hypothetical protein